MLLSVSQTLSTTSATATSTTTSNSNKSKNIHETNHSIIPSVRLSSHKTPALQGNIQAQSHGKPGTVHASLAAPPEYLQATRSNNIGVSDFQRLLDIHDVSSGSNQRTRTDDRQARAPLDTSGPPVLASGKIVTGLNSFHTSDRKKPLLVESTPAYQNVHSNTNEYTNKESSMNQIPTTATKPSVTVKDTKITYHPHPTGIPVYTNNNSGSAANSNKSDLPVSNSTNDHPKGQSSHQQQVTPLYLQEPRPPNPPPPSYLSPRGPTSTEQTHNVPRDSRNPKPLAEYLKDEKVKVSPDHLTSSSAPPTSQSHRRSSYPYVPSTKDTILASEKSMKGVVGEVDYVPPRSARLDITLGQGDDLEEREVRRLKYEKLKMRKEREAQERLRDKSFERGMARVQNVSPKVRELSSEKEQQKLLQKEVPTNQIKFESRMQSNNINKNSDSNVNSKRRLSAPPTTIPHHREPSPQRSVSSTSSTTAARLDEQIRDMIRNEALKVRTKCSLLAPRSCLRCNVLLDNPWRFLLK